MVKKALIALGVMLFAFVSSSGLSETDFKSFQNSKPSFSISIPGHLSDWQIRRRGLREKPVVFLKPHTRNLPFIDTFIDFYDAMTPEIKRKWSNADELFKTKTFYDKAFEKEVLPDVEFIKDQRIMLAGKPAMDRIYRSQKSGVTYHTIYILFPEGIVQFGLNAFTASFEQDDKDFLSIMTTFKAPR